MRILVYDTETTGLPEKGAGPHDYHKWPHIVQLSFIVYDAPVSVPLITLSPIIVSDFIVKPDGYEIPKDSSQIHGITHAEAMRIGLPIKEVLTYFLAQLEQADVIVAHNAAFDKNTIHAEMFRCGLLVGPKWKTRPTAKEFCTMNAATNICRRSFATKPGDPVHPYPYDNRTKWPRLDELFRTLFPHEEPPPSLHNSLVDVRVTARCFLTMVDSGLISISGGSQPRLDEEIPALPVPVANRGGLTPILK